MPQSLPNHRINWSSCSFAWNFKAALRCQPYGWLPRSPWLARVARLLCRLKLSGFRLFLLQLLLMALMLFAIKFSYALIRMFFFFAFPMCTMSRAWNLTLCCSRFSPTAVTLKCFSFEFGFQIEFRFKFQISVWIVREPHKHINFRNRMTKCSVINFVITIMNLVSVSWNWNIWYVFKVSSWFLLFVMFACKTVDL